MSVLDYLGGGAIVALLLGLWYYRTKAGAAQEATERLGILLKVSRNSAGYQRRRAEELEKAQLAAYERAREKLHVEGQAILDNPDAGARADAAVDFVRRAFPGGGASVTPAPVSPAGAPAAPGPER